MSETYDITYDGANVGWAQKNKQGLYVIFSCHCQLPDDGLYRIHAICGGHREDLGICVPMDGGFGIDKRIPAKRLREDIFSFELVPNNWKPQEITPEAEPEPVAVEEETALKAEILPEEPCGESFIPVYEEEPFEYMDKLEDARMEVRDGCPGIVLAENEDA